MMLNPSVGWRDYRLAQNVDLLISHWMATVYNIILRIRDTDNILLLSACDLCY